MIRSVIEIAPLSRGLSMRPARAPDPRAAGPPGSPDAVAASWQPPAPGAALRVLDDTPPCPLRACRARAGDVVSSGHDRLLSLPWAPRIRRLAPAMLGNCKPECQVWMKVTDVWWQYIIITAVLIFGVYCFWKNERSHRRKHVRQLCRLAPQAAEVCQETRRRVERGRPQHDALTSRAASLASPLVIMGAPNNSVEEVNPRVAASPEQVRQLLTAVSYVGAS